MVQVSFNASHTPFAIVRCSLHSTTNRAIPQCRSSPMFVSLVQFLRITERKQPTHLVRMHPRNRPHVSSHSYASPNENNQLTLSGCTLAIAPTYRPIPMHHRTKTTNSPCPDAPSQSPPRTYVPFLSPSPFRPLVPFSVSAFTFWRTRGLLRGSFLTTLREQELCSSLHIKNVSLARASTGENHISTSWSMICGGGVAVMTWAGSGMVNLNVTRIQAHISAAIR
jgi:hypothetical protein